jgi:host factor-I protein
MDKGKPKSKAKPLEHTGEEARYLRFLVDKEVPVLVRLKNNQEFCGTVEFYDVNFIRLTRADGPNLFVYKRDIKYVAQEG